MRSIRLDIVLFLFSGYSSFFAYLRVNGTLYMHQNVCLNLVKKDQLCAIALMNRK